jgi:signal transduction histidine kinase
VTSTYKIPPNRSLGLRRSDIAWGVAAEPEKWRAHQETLDRHEPFRDFTYRNWLEGDEFIHITVSGKPVFDAEGRFTGYRGTAREITEQVQAEERLRAAMMEAEAANQAKISFLANMSHELRTPLNAILGFSEMIRDQLLGPQSPRYAEYAGFISESGSHLLTLVNDVLDMAKIDAGHMTLSPSDVDLPALVRRQVAMMLPRAAARGVAIAVDCPEDFPGVRVDELRMRQIVLNLLSNAVKFTMAEGRVTATTRIDETGRPVIAIADTGIGMTADEIALALEPFRQVETHMDRTQEGTGLGLPITRNLVALHGGELVIQSEPGRGTTVEVVLPASVVVL